MKKRNIRKKETNKQIENEVQDISDIKKSFRAPSTWVKDRLEQKFQSQV
jgi:hypothetical protein